MAAGPVLMTVFLRLHRARVPACVAHEEGRPPASLLSLTRNPFCLYNCFVVRPAGGRLFERGPERPTTRLPLLNAVAIDVVDYDISTR